MKIRTLLTFLVFGLIFAGVLLLHPSSASASFNANSIIDDALFNRVGSMDAGQIDAWLNTFPNSCISPNSGFDARVPTGYSPSGGFTYGGFASAGQVISAAASVYGLNPQVLLVTLQKEQSLVVGGVNYCNDGNENKYAAAVGYGCPDGGTVYNWSGVSLYRRNGVERTNTGSTCVNTSSKAGFSQQVIRAAWLLKFGQQRSLGNVGWAVIFGAWNNSDDPPTCYGGPMTQGTLKRCQSGAATYYDGYTTIDGTSVHIDTGATAALYWYTPHFHGNQNFVSLFESWFGLTNGTPTSSNLRLVTPITTSPANPAAGQTVTVSFTIQNFGTDAVTYQNAVLQCRLNTSTNCDPNWDSGATINPNDQKTFTYSLGLVGGTYILTPYFLQGNTNTWYRYNSGTIGDNSLKLNVPDMRLVTPITTSPANPIAGQAVTVSYAVQNFGSSSVVYDTSVLQCRLNTNTNCDSSYGAPTTIAPGERRIFTHSLAPFAWGSYNLVPYFMQNGVWYQYIGSNNSQQLSVPDMRIVGQIVTNPSNPIPGQAVTVSYNVQNFGASAVSFQSSILQCRYNGATNCDPAYDSPITIEPGARQLLTVNLPSVKAGSYMLTPYFLQNGNWYPYGSATPTGYYLKLDVPAYVADMRVVGAITSTPTNPLPGQSTIVSYTVQNFGSQPAIFQSSVLQCRLNGTVNCDPAWDAPITIDAGDQHTFNINIPIGKAGTYVFTPYFMQNDTWHIYGSATPTGYYLKLDVPAYVADMYLTSPISVSPASPNSGQTMTVSFSAQNFADASQPAIFQSSVLQCRLNGTVNCDPAWDAPITIDVSGSHTFTYTFPATKSGTYRFTPYFMQNDTWHLYKIGPGGSNSTLTVTVP